MARRSGVLKQTTFDAIRKAGLLLIYRHGYEAMSLRQLASEVGLVQGSLYNHIATKQDLLFRLIVDHMAALLQAVDEALAGLTDPEERLDQFVRFHVNYHIDRKMEVFISYSELRSLEPNNFRVIVGMRRDYERRLMDILRDGIDAGVFQTDDTKTATFGILAMLSGVCTWYKPNGRLSRDEICEIFVRMTRESVARDASKVSTSRKTSVRKVR